MVTRSFIPSSTQASRLRGLRLGHYPFDAAVIPRKGAVLERKLGRLLHFPIAASTAFSVGSVRRRALAKFGAIRGMTPVSATCHATGPALSTLCAARSGLRHGGIGSHPADQRVSLGTRQRLDC